MSHNPLLDAYHRPLKDLRISLIDRCNLRCRYCMPAHRFGQNHRFLPKNEWLQFGEIVRLAKIFLRLGVSKIRLTGGEPLLRPDVIPLIKTLSRLDGLEDLALTTNGLLLPALASDLKKTGLKRVTISLDSLNETTFRKLSGGHGSVKAVLKGIQAAQQAGFNPIKINCVVQKGFNDTPEEILSMVEWAQKEGVILRFIEYMDVGGLNEWSWDDVVSAETLHAIISQRYSLKPLPQKTHDTAYYYRIDGSPHDLGFIASVTRAFCGDCSRGRISATGGFHTCLFAPAAADLKQKMRAGATDEELCAVITDIWRARRDRYSQQRLIKRQNIRSERTSEPKPEMFVIGG